MDKVSEIAKYHESTTKLPRFTFTKVFYNHREMNANIYELSTFFPLLVLLSIPFLFFSFPSFHLNKIKYFMHTAHICVTAIFEYVKKSLCFFTCYVNMGSKNRSYFAQYALAQRKPIKITYKTACTLNKI